MSLETTIFTFKISVPFEEWAKGFDSPDVDALHKANAVTPLYRGVSKDNPQSVVVVHQAEDGIRDRSPSRGLGDVYKRQIEDHLY